MPAGRFTPQETLAASRRLHEHLNAQEQEYNRYEARLRNALALIKAHIGPDDYTHNRVLAPDQIRNQDLHQAIALIVDFARKHETRKQVHRERAHHA